MKLTTETQDVEVQGVLESNTFTIKTSAKAFQILSSNLYSNTIGAVIRELSTNAYDAHVTVGRKDEPFIIKMPNALDPTFKIRDFGPGLSPEQIKTVYTTFFESTKTDSNDVVGCLGLGSKSPFGVTDSFTIISYHDNKKSVYSAYLDKFKMPKCDLFYQEETFEPSGIEIEVAIKKEDIKTFTDEVNTQLKYFTTKPIILGDSNFTWDPEEEYILEGTNWKLVSGNYWYNSCKILQGQIAYPIDKIAMGTKYNESSKIIKDLLRMNILIEVEIGEVNIAPSREALSYDENTVDNILKYVNRILEELPDAVTKAIADSKTEWLARLKYQEIMNSLGGQYSSVKNYLDKTSKILYKGKDVSSNILKLPEEYIEAYRQYTRNYNMRWRKSNIVLTRTYYADRPGENTYWRIIARNNKQMILFYATPDDKAVDARVKQYMNDMYQEAQRTRDVYNIPTAHIIVSTKSLESVREKMGYPEMIECKTLDKVRKAKGTPKNKTDIVLQKFNPYGWYKKDHWEPEVIEDLPNLKGYYVELDRFDTIYNGKKLSELSTYVEAANELKLIDTTLKIYGLRKANMKKDHNLINLYDHIKAEFVKGSHAVKYEFGCNARVARRISSERGLAESMAEKLKNTDSPIKELLEYIKHNEEFAINHKQKELMKALNLETPVIDKSEISSLIDERYFMLAEAGYYLTNVTAVKYVQQMDKLYKLEENKIDVVSGFLSEITKAEEANIEFGIES